MSVAQKADPARFKFTPASVRAKKPPKAGRKLWWDTHLPGFGLRLTANGARSWIVVVRKQNRRSTSKLYIGDAEDMPLAEARAAARAKMEVPDEPAEAESNDTFGALAEKFLEHGRTKRGRVLRSSTVKEYRRALLTYAADLHAKPVRDVRRGDIADLIRDVAKARGATTAMRTRAALSRFFSWLLANDKVEGNPVMGTEGYETAKRDRVLSDGELCAIWSATEPRSDFNMIVRLMLWTGTRRSEPGGMRWSELSDNFWTVPGSRTKNHRPLSLPLPRQALQALEGWPRVVGRDFVFGRGRNGFQGWSKAKERLDARLGFARPWDLHDLRRSVETRMAGLSIPKDHVNRVLNHAAGPITERYDHHTYLPEKRAALQFWADELESIIGHGGSKVVALDAARLNLN
jgi:integrase